MDKREQLSIWEYAGGMVWLADRPWKAGGALLYRQSSDIAAWGCSCEDCHGMSDLRPVHIQAAIGVGYSNAMAPTIVRDGPFRLFFFSREETRIHVHVSHVDGEAKFWLTPQVALANHTGLSETQLRQAQAVVNAHLKEIQDAWNHHFAG